MNAHATQIPQKEFIFREASTKHVSPDTVKNWIYKGRYQGLHKRKINSSIVLVNPNTARLKPLSSKRTKYRKFVNGQPTKVWMADRALVLGISVGALAMRINRGKERYPKERKI